LDEVLRALRALPGEANDEMRVGTRKLSRTLADEARRAGEAYSPQAARAARTVRAVDGATPSVQAGPHVLLFGSEFGMTRHSGWYARRRYWNSTGRQFGRHLGGGSYWFFDTAENSPEIGEQWREMADGIIRRWGA
jgi:hypothetical protein